MEVFGREKELSLLEGLYQSQKSELVVIYGRRRIGKSLLIQQFCKSKITALKFEAIEGEYALEQIQHFQVQLRTQVRDPFLGGVEFKNWEAIFEYLTQYLKKQEKKVILFMDEFQWQASNQQKLVSLIKFYWDNQWKPYKPILILCGSVSSFMVGNVIRSKALYGRVTCEMNLKGLLPRDAKKMLGKYRDDIEILKYLLVLGSVPKYLEEINKKQSFYQNINNLFFAKNSLMLNEIDRVFYSQFRQAGTYLKIVRCLGGGPATQEKIRHKIKISSGGGASSYIKNLELADFIRGITSLNRPSNSRIQKYYLADEYLTFYFKYIEPNLRAIQLGGQKRLFEKVSKDSFDKWMGIAFEKFCLKYCHELASAMGFEDEFIDAAPYFEKKSDAFQIDLIFKRTDKIFTICEIKFYHQPVGTEVIPEVERKCKLFPLPQGYALERALISPYGPDKSLYKSEYFHHYVTLKKIYS